MAGAFASVEAAGGAVSVSAHLNGFTLAELRFPPGYDQPVHDPDDPYVATVLDGSLVKTFDRRTVALDAGRTVTIPAGARHAARFGPRGARVAIVKLREQAPSGRRCLDRVAALHAPQLAWLAGRLAGELRQTDSAAPLAAEGYALELLAAVTREASPPGRTTACPAWLVDAEELLRTRRDCVRLAELAEAVGVGPARLARGFHRRHGISVGEFGRRARLDWAAGELLGGDAPLAAVAAEAGFADQSHFTRLFRRRFGTTPARFRHVVRAPRVPAS